jgi:predicted anti-sigma-YlaC factor YlaD
MSSTSTGHLTDDQFTECVALTPSAASEAHLLECAHCRQELIGFTTSMEDFSRAAFAWSEAQPAVSLRAAARPRGAGHSRYAPAGWAVAAALVLAVGVPFVLHHDRQTNVTPGVALVDAPDDSEAQIAEDNQLMRSVNMAIGVNDPSLMREYGLQAPRRVRLRTVSGSKSE